ncbi:MAG: peptidoglycan-binding protein [Candidatus Pacebacteria bacterium]|nr:peptidoglycan-binding protein [Candidatus Paceibacterota bacterium]
MTVLAGFFAFGFSIKAEAAARIASVDGNWTDTATWGGQSVPVAGDDVTINTDIVVIVDTAVEATSISINDPVAAANGITVETGGSITLTGALTFSGSSSTAHSTVAVESGSLTAASIAIADGAGTGDSIVSVGTGGTVTSSGDITFTGTFSDMHLVATGTGEIVMSGTTGTIGTGGTVSLASGSTVSFTGTGAQTVPVYAYGNIIINKSGGTATLFGDTWLGGSLTISAGTFDTGTHGFDVTSLTTIADGATLIHGTGHKIQNGNLVIDEGGTWTETGEATVQFLGHVTNNGTFTANTGLHTFGTFPRTINGTLSIPNVTFTGDYTNNGTFTVGTSLAGTHTLTNGATGILNIGGTSTITTLTASAAGNTVNYTGAGQTIKIPTGDDYDTLTLGGSGTKTIASGINVAGDLTIEDNVRANVTGASTANKLYLDGDLQFVGIWGSNASDAQFKNNNFFSGTGTVTTADGTTPRSNSGGGSIFTRVENLKNMGKTEEAEKLEKDFNQVFDKEIPTIESLMKRIAELQALLVKLQGQPTSPTSPLVCSPLLKQGVRSPEVVKLQQLLKVEPQSGFFGPLTAQAVRAFQTEKGILADAVAGSDTCKLLSQQ